VKAFFAHGGRDYIASIIDRIIEGTDLVQLSLQRWCLQLLWMWTCALSWDRCWGSGFVRVIIESQSTVRSGLKQETEFVLSLMIGSSSVKRRKKASALLPFLDTLSELLRDKMDFPLTKPKKGSDGTAIGTHVSDIFSILNLPVNFRAMLEVDKARELFFSFLEILSPPQPTRTDFANCVLQFIRAHRARRSLPASFFRALLRIMAGDTASPNYDVVTEPSKLPKEVSSFSIAKVQDIWVLSQILTALPATADDTAVTFLWELNDFFTRTPHANTNLLEDNFHLWFFPILFDTPDNEDASAPGKKDRVMASEHLAVDILSGAHAFHLLAHLRVREPAGNEHKSAGPQPHVLTTEELLANTLVAIGFALSHLEYVFMSVIYREQGVACCVVLCSAVYVCVVCVV